MRARFLFSFYVHRCAIVSFFPCILCLGFIFSESKTNVYFAKAQALTICATTVHHHFFLMIIYFFCLHVFFFAVVVSKYYFKKNFFSGRVSFRSEWSVWMWPVEVWLSSYEIYILNILLTHQCAKSKYFVKHQKKTKQCDVVAGV